MAKIKTKATNRSKATLAPTASSLDALAAQAANDERAIKRHYSREFKLSAVRLVKEQAYSVVAAAKSLGVDDHNVRDWVNALGDQVGGPVDGEAARPGQRARQLHPAGWGGVAGGGVSEG